MITIGARAGAEAGQGFFFESGYLWVIVRLRYPFTQNIDLRELIPPSARRSSFDAYSKNPFTPKMGNIFDSTTGMFFEQASKLDLLAPPPFLIF